MLHESRSLVFLRLECRGINVNVCVDSIMNLHLLMNQLPV